MKEKTSIFKENFLFWLMFGVFFILWLTTTVIFIAFSRYYGVYGTEGSIGAYANLLVFDATIFAPIAAYFFYDNWKDQHNQNIISAEAKEAFKNINKLTQTFSFKNVVYEYIDSEEKDENKLIKNFELITEEYNQILSDLDLIEYLTDDDSFKKYKIQIIQQYSTAYRDVLEFLTFEDNDSAQKLVIDYLNATINTQTEIKKNLQKYIILKK